MSRIVMRETRRRGPFGWIVKIAFIAFNLGMAVWMFDYYARVGARVEAGAQPEAAGAGLVLGTAFLLAIWMMGAVILGIAAALTRGAKVTISETE